MANIVYKNGYPFIKAGDEYLAPCMFRSFRPTPANVSLFHRAGVRIHQMLVSGEMNGMDIPYSLYGGVWLDDGVYNFEAFDRQIEMFKKYAPNDYYIIFIQLDAPEEWINKHKKAVSSFYNLQTMGHHEEYRKAASEYLKNFISYCEEKYGECICGYGISAGRSCEWFCGNDFSSELLAEEYKKYTGDENIQIPLISKAEEKENILREPSSAEIGFMRFCEKNTKDIALYFAHEAQKVLQHKKFLGLFGGYHALYDNSLLVNAFEDVWESEDIDSIWAPASYDKFRELENASAFTCPMGSLKIKQKLHVNELDHRTDMAYYPLEHPVAKNRMAYRLLPGNLVDDCYKTSYEAIMVLRRELAASLQQGSALWWFDFFGGYFASPEYEKMLADHVRIYNKVINSPTPLESVAEIAVIVNTKAMTYVKDGRHDHYDFTYNNILELAKCGVPYEVYNIADIEKIDKNRIKLYIFLNAFEIENSEYIKALEAEKLWIYAPNVMREDKINYDGISEITDIEVKLFTTDEILHIETPVGAMHFSNVINPMIEIVDKNAEILGRYVENGKAAYARKGNNCYISCGNLTSSFFRRIAKENGLHVYSETDGALYINNHFISFETTESEDITLNLKADTVFEELFDGGIYKSQEKKLKYNAKKGTTKLFYIKQT